MGADNGSNKVRKAELVKRERLCPFCPYNRGENRKSKPRRSDRYKSERKGR